MYCILVIVRPLRDPVVAYIDFAIITNDLVFAGQFIFNSIGVMVATHRVK
jgi:hypothetical protein